MIQNKKYSNYVSLGSFCSVALELEKFGLRSASYPFDWLLTDFKGVVEAINSNFEGLFTESLYEQSKEKLYVYRNMKYGFDFVHDFSKYKSFYKQFSSFKEKYSRRIERFYCDICNPTLFIRYIKDLPELIWIEKNSGEIYASIRKYNSENDLLFVANEGITSDCIQIYNVTPDKNDSVCRNFFSANDSLKKFFSSCIFPKREVNLLRYRNKNSTTKKYLRMIRKNFMILFKKLFYSPYIHDRSF